jgi:hypothetical protein
MKKENQKMKKVSNHTYLGQPIRESVSGVAIIADTTGAVQEDPAFSPISSPSSSLKQGAPISTLTRGRFAFLGRSNQAQ